MKLASGMDEVGHTKTDTKGKFSFTFDESNAPYMVRATPQVVTYHRPARRGTDSVEVQVYDSSSRVDGVHAIADLMYLQASNGQLSITRIFAVDNTSKPPRTQMNDANFEFYVPEGTDIDAASARTAGGQDVNIAPTPQAEKRRYAFVFPLRPGQTEFQVTYHQAYGGKAKIDPRLLFPLHHLVAILPRPIRFTPAQSGVYEAKQPPGQPAATSQDATNP